VLPFDETHDQRWAEGIIGRYQVGRPVTAYYNPRDPSEAFLLKQYAVAPWILCGIGLPLIAPWFVFGPGRALRRRPRSA
jgi:uncharacterized protein DUF3592